MTPRSTPTQVAGLAGWLLLAFAAAGIGAVASVSARTFYAALVRPMWAPPGWLFGPVWSVLYVAMAVAAWLVWRKRAFGGARVALGLFIVQIAVNALWSWLFFAWHQGALAFAEILMLMCLIIATVVAFRRVSKPAALLLLPYLGWVAFASVLMFEVWQLNPNEL